MWSVLALLLQETASASAPAAVSLQPPCGAAVSTAAALPPTRTAHQVLQAEYGRGADLWTLRYAVTSADSTLQRLGARALGRAEVGNWATFLVPLLRAPAASVRREAILAGTQMGAVAFGAACVATGSADRDPSVRAVAYASLGRSTPPGVEWEARLAAGLRDSALAVKRGAARGLEAFYRRGRRTFAATDSVVQALERTAAEVSDREFTLLAAMARHAALLTQPMASRTALGTWATSLRTHDDAQVRRLAVMMAPYPEALRDVSPLVRIEMVRPSVALSAEELAMALRDSDEHVRLLAIDRVAGMTDGEALLQPLLAPAQPWRTRAHAVMALARISGERARPHVRALSRSAVWQARAWAARAAVAAGDSLTLQHLARDPEPNVRLEAITTVRDAYAALGADHAGLVLAGAEFLSRQQGPDSVRLRHAEAAARAFERISRTRPVTWRDPRVALLKLVARHSQQSPSLGGTWMAQWLRDADPEIQRLATAALPSWHAVSRDTSGAAPVSPPRYVPPAFAGERELDAVRGATAEIRIRGKGSIVLDLLEEIAPMTVVTFVRLAERGAYTGRTLHRVVPNFVVQGGSPGADEYDPATDFFMRDEVGASNVRGSVGISTRGRDTGDGQFYFNLVDNVRLDFDYTVFANAVRGLEVMDRIQEGDVIESVVIRRAEGRRTSRL